MSDKKIVPLLKELDNIKIDNLMTLSELNNIVYALKKFRASLSYGVTVKTVASEETENKENYDYMSFSDAIEDSLTKLQMSSGHVVLILEKGTHLITRDLISESIGGVGIPSYPINHTHLTIISEADNMNDTIVTLDKNVKVDSYRTLFRIEEARLNITNITIDLFAGGNTNIEGKYVTLFRYSSSYSFLYKVRFVSKDKKSSAIYIDPNTELGTMYCEFEQFRFGMYLIRNGYVTNYKNKYKNCAAPIRIIGSGRVIDAFGTREDCDNEVINRGMLGGSTSYEPNKINLDGGYLNNGQHPLTFINDNGNTKNRPTFNDKANGFIYYDTEKGYPVIWNGEKYLKINVSDE